MIIDLIHAANRLSIRSERLAVENKMLMEEVKKKRLQTKGLTNELIRSVRDGAK